MSVCLVVDDSKGGRTLQSAWLVRNGGWLSENIKTAATLKEALDICHKFQVSMVSLDLNLSDSKGIVTLRTIVDKGRISPGLIWVVTSSVYDPEIVRECEEYGVQGVVPPGMEPWRGPNDEFTERQKEQIAEIVSNAVGEGIRREIDEALKAQRQISKAQQYDKLIGFLKFAVAGIIGSALIPFVIKLFSAGLVSLIGEIKK